MPRKQKEQKRGFHGRFSQSINLSSTSAVEDILQPPARLLNTVFELHKECDIISNSNIGFKQHAEGVTDLSGFNDALAQPATKVTKTRSDSSSEDNFIFFTDSATGVPKILAFGSTFD